MAVGDKTNVPAIKDLTGVSQVAGAITSGVIGTVGEQMVVIEPIADDDYVIAAGDTITTVNGILTVITPA